MIEKKMRQLFKYDGQNLMIILAALGLIELGILITCYLTSTQQDIVKIMNANNEVVYEDAYNLNNISQFKKIAGIHNFKKEGFVVIHKNVEGKFPTRAWIALSVCVPLMLILFVVFVVKVLTDVFHWKITDEKEVEKDQSAGFEETKFEKIFSTLGRLNIYSLVGTVILAAFFLWMVPDLIIHLGKISYQTVSELKWVILCVVIFTGVILIVRAYFSYKTKIEVLKQQADIQKHRDQLVIGSKMDNMLLDEKPSGPTQHLPPVDVDPVENNFADTDTTDTPA